MSRVNLLRELWERGIIAACNTVLRCFIGYIDLRSDGVEIGYAIDLGLKPVRGFVARFRNRSTTNPLTYIRYPKSVNCS